MAKETRYFPTELRVDSEGRVEGYAAVFDQFSQILGWFREKIRKGAFAKTLREADVRALFNHDPNYVLGRNRADTLEMFEDDHGLHFRATPPDTQWANDLRQSIERGDIDQGSFGFDTVRDEWNYEVEPNERELIEVRLWDVSVVTFPAYPQTSVSARSLAHMFINQAQRDQVDPETLKLLRDQLSLLDAPSAAPGENPHPVEVASEGDEEAARASHRLALRKRRLQLKQLRQIGD